MYHTQLRKIIHSTFIALVVCLNLVIPSPPLVIAALPVTISGVVFPTNNANGRLGPFLSSGGNFYAVFLDSTDTGNVDIFKATDPTDSWSQQATLDVGGANAVQVMAVHQEDDNLHIVTDNAGEITLEYHVFSMSSDSFTISNEAITSSISDNNEADKTVDISVRSDGDVIVVYAGDEDNAMGAKNRVDYARREGGTWTVDIAVDDAGAVNYEGPEMVRGESDLMHIVWDDATNADILHKSLNSSNSLSSVEIVSDSLSDNTSIRSVTRPTFYDAAGVERITVIYRINAIPITSVIIEDDGIPDTEETVSATVARIVNNTVILTAAVDNKTVHVLYAEGLSFDLFHDLNTDDGGWGTDVEELDNVTINAISANVYDRASFTRLAFVYDDGGTIKYNEVQLAAVGGRPSSGALLGVGSGVSSP